MQFPTVDAIRPSHSFRLRTVVNIFALVGLIISSIALSPEIKYGGSDRQFLVAAEASAGMNVALSANGAVASASSTYPDYNFSPGAAIDGERKGLNYLNGGAWHGANNTFPQWLQIDFSGSKTIEEIDVFTLQDNYTNPSEPTEVMTFSLYGLTGYDLQYWNDNAWVTVTGGSISGNNKVWRKITFSPITTTKVRVLTNGSVDGWTRTTEVEAWATASENLTEAAESATINFDTLSTGTVVTNQYAQVKFSATGFAAGSGGPNGDDLFVVNNNGLGSSPYNAIRGRYNPYYSPYSCSGGSDVFLDFPVPVNNLRFLMLNMYANYFGSPSYTYVPYRSGIIDVYVNRLYYGTYDIYIPGEYRSPNTPFPVNFLSGIPGITGIRITNISRIPGGPVNAAPSYACGTIFYDDFTFTPDLAVGITNARVNGVLNGTSQTALVGADIALNASVIPSTRTGGSYSWTVSPSATIVAGANSSSVTIRTIDVGTVTANVTYTLNGVPVSGSVSINAVLPSLTSFTAQQGSDGVRPPGQCRPDSFWWYKLGCSPQNVGMNFSASVHAPSFISDPTQSGIKYVQAVSAFRKRNEIGLRCGTKRSSESDIGSGWQLDTSDPYDPAHRFSEGNDLTMVTVDYPDNALTLISAYEFTDVLYVDDRFEMYLVYFTGSSATSPVFQRPLGKLVWNWGGLVVLDWNGSDAVHHLRSSNASPGLRTGAAASSMVSMQGNVKGNGDVPCPGGPPLTSNHIDSSRVFVKYHYLDFLGRHPDGDATHPADPVGWNFWTSGISQCLFDLNCIHAKRVDTGLAFFYSGEFIQTDPDMANPPGSPGFNPIAYNRAFVKYSYLKYLRRNPVDDPGGWDYWTNDLNSTGNYGHMIDAFLSSTEYRSRSFY